MNHRMSKRALASITRDGIVIHENCFDRIQDMEISRSPVILSGAGLTHYDEVLCDIYSRLRLDSLWINGTSYSDSMKIISEWLYRRNKS